MTLHQIKTHLSIRQVLGHYGLTPDKHGMMNCPFHPDKTPSMRVYHETHTVYCFSSNCPTHDHSLDVIDFVMHKEACSKHEAIIKAQKLIGMEAVETKTSAVAIAAIAKPLMAEAERVELLTYIWAQLQSGMNEEAGKYLQSRGLNVQDPRLRPYLGYAAGKIHSRAPKGTSLADYRTGLQHLGLITPLKKGYRSWANGCIVFPLRNGEGEIVSFYGRNAKGGTGKHYYLPQRQGLFPAYPDAATETLILTESIIDAATLLQTVNTPVLALYGTNGLTEEHRQAIKALSHLRELILFFDGDEAGEKAAKKYAGQLTELLPGVTISQVLTPVGEDVNSLVQLNEPKVFTKLIEARQMLFLSVEKKKNMSSELDTNNPHRLCYQGAEAGYQVLGGLRKDLDSLKVTLSVLHEHLRSRQKLDLYEDSQIEKAAKRAGDKLGLRADLIELDLNQLTDLLDGYRETLLADSDKKAEKPQLSPEEETVIRHFLTQPKLFHRINDTLGKAGVVGEKRNRLFLYTCAGSYKQKTPLHVLSQGASGMGKTHTQEVIAACLPEEDVIEITRMTDYSFYNYGEHELSHKALFIEDMDTLSEEAMLALREMQSKGRITLSTTVKNEQGQMRAERKTVYGPLSTIGATTQGGVYEDNAGRCFILAMDESLEQTRRIIAYQNELAAGEIDRKEQEQARKLLQNCMRLLQPSEVINPFAQTVNLPEEASKLRRLNGFFNGLTAQITWLHQLQRKRDKQGRLISEKEDIVLAIELFLDALIWKIDELDGSLRGFYERLKEYIKDKGGDSFQGYHFGQRDVRMALRISRTQLQRYLRDLLDLEYIHLVSQRMGKGYRYQIAWWDDAKAMRERVRTHLRSQLDDHTDPSDDPSNEQS